MTPVGHVFERSIQLLACEFHLRTDVEALVERFDSLRASAIQDHPVTRRHRFEVRRHPDGYGIREDSQPAEVVSDLEDAFMFVDRRLHELAFSGLADYTKLHAGCGTWYGRRFLVVGDKGAGKTTLMTRLLFEGCAVEGDEMVLLRDGRAVVYPRRFGIRRRTLKLVPQVGALAPHLLGTPGADEPGGYHVLAFDPSQLGFEWRITMGPVGAVFFLVARVDGPTHIARCSTDLIAQWIMARSTPPSGGSSAWIRDVGALVRGATTYRVVLGDLDSAVASMRQCFANG